MYRRRMRQVPEHPRTLGEQLRQTRMDRRMTNVEVAHILGVAYQTVEKWEHNRTLIGPKSRPRIIAFISYDPEASDHNPKGGSNAI